MKKALTLVLAVLMLLSLFSVSAMAEAGKTQITFWHMYGDSSGINDVIADFNASQDEIEVVASYYSSHDDLLTKLQVTAAAGSTEKPNVILIDCVKVGPVDEIFPLVDLTDYIAAEDGLDFEDFYPVFQRFSKNAAGEIVSLHMASNCLVMYYNKALFEAAGLDPEVGPKNWDEIIEFGQKLTDADKGVWGYEPNFIRDPSNEGYSWEWQAQTMTAGGEIWNDDFTQIKFTENNAAVEALQFWHDCIYKYGITSMSPAENAFENGFVGMQVGGTWAGGSYAAALGDDLGVSVLYGKDGVAKTCAGGEHLMIVESDEEHEDASWKFISYMMSEKANAYICKQNGMCPTRASIAHSESFADVLKIPYIAVTDEMLANYAVTRCTRADYPQFSQIVHDYVQAVMYDTMSPEDAVAAMAADITSALGL